MSDEERKEGAGTKGGLDSVDLDAAQDQISKALDRARAGESKALASQVRELGEQFAKMFNSCIRLTRLHDPSNDAFNTPISELQRLLAELLELLGAVHVVVVGGQVYVNDIRVRFEATDVTGDRIEQSLRPHQVGGVSWHQAATDPQLRAFVLIIGSTPSGKGHPRAECEYHLSQAGLDFIDLSPLFRFRAYGEGEKGQAQEFQVVYNRSTQLVADSWSNLSSRRQPNPLPMRRLVTSLIDMTRG